MTTHVSSPLNQMTIAPIHSSVLGEVPISSVSSSTSFDDRLRDSSAIDVKPVISTPSQLSTMPNTPIIQTDLSPLANIKSAPSMESLHGGISKSSPLVSACGSPAPQTPQSRCSASSPLSQHTLSDSMLVTLPPPSYMSSVPAADNALLSPSSVQSSSPLDTLKSGLPPPPKKPLTPYMRFSKSVIQVVCILP